MDWLAESEDDKVRITNSKLMFTSAWDRLVHLFSMDFNLGFLFIFPPKVLDALVFELGLTLASFFVFFFLDLFPFTRNPCPHVHPQRLKRISLLILL